MKLHCPICTAEIHLPHDLNDLKASFTAQNYLQTCSCGVALVVNYALKKGAGVIMVNTFVSGLKPPDIGPVQHSYSFKAEDVGEMKSYPLGNPDDPPLVPRRYRITSVEPNANPGQVERVAIERDENDPALFWVKIADPDDLSGLGLLSIPPAKTWRDRAIEDPIL